MAALRARLVGARDSGGGQGARPQVREDGGGRHPVGEDGHRPIPVRGHDGLGVL